MPDVDPIAAEIAQAQRDATSIAGVPPTPPPAEYVSHPVKPNPPGYNPRKGPAPLLDATAPVLEPGGDVAPVPAQDALPPRGVERAPAGEPADAGADPIAAQIRQEQQQEDALQGQLLDWRAKNDSTDAGTRADVLRYSAASGLDPAFVEKNLDAVKRKVDAEKVDWNEVAYRQPSLVKYLLDSPEATPLVKDDAANLGGLEWAIKAPFHAFIDAINEQRSIARQFTEAQGLGGEENRKKIEVLESQYSNKDYGADSFITRGLVGTARMGPFIAGDIAARWLGGVAGVAIAGGGGAGTGAAAGAPAGGVGAVPGATVGAVAGGVTGGAVGQFVGSGIFNYYEALGPLYWRLSKLKDSNGEPMDPSVARAFAQGGAVIQAGLMAGFMGKVGAALPGAKQLLERFGANTIEKALADASVTAMKRGAFSFGKHWLTGATMMAGQSAVNAAAEESAKAASGQPFEVHLGNITSAAANGFKTGLEDMWLLSALGPGREMLKDVGRARASAESNARLEAMTSSAAGSKLLERFPEGFQKLVEKMKGEKGAVENVFVPAEEWAAYWQAQKLNPGEVAAAVLGDGGKAFADAVSSKGDLAIPVEKYLTKLAKTEHAEGLAEHSKLRADELTAHQFGEEQKRLKDRLKEEAKVRGSELAEGKQEVHDFIHEQALAAGIGKEEAKANAKLVSEYAGAMALRLGVSVHEAANLGALGRLRILGPKGEAVAAAAREKFRGYLHPEASRLLNEHLDSVTPDSPVLSRDLVIDKNTGILNEKGFSELPPQEGKEMFGHISVEGIKHLNETTTHEHADLLYRAVAKALHEVDPQAAKVGGDFAVRVKDAAELQAVVAKVKENLPAGLRGFDVTGEVGKTLDEAGVAHRAKLDAAIARGERANPRPPNPADPKGKPLAPEKPKGLSGEAKDILFPEERASAKVPEEIAKRIAGLSKEEYFKEAYVEPHTGLLTALAWSKIPRKAHVALLDVKGLRGINDKFGSKGGDAVLRRFGELATHFGGSSFDLTHLHGDEYALQHNDPLALARFVERFGKIVHTSGATIEGPDGEPLSVPLSFWFGLGKGSLEAADADLNNRKQRAKAAEAGASADELGRGSSGQQADGLHGRGPSGLGTGDVRGGFEGETEIGLGGVGQGRGASPQGFPGSGEQPQEAVAGITKAREVAARMRPENRAQAHEFLDYVEGLRSDRPAIPDELYKKLTEHVADPQGFAFDENGRSMERGLGGRQVRGTEPEELRRQRLSEQSRLEHGVSRTRYDQPSRFESVDEIIAEQDRKKAFLDSLAKEEIPRDFPMRDGGKMLISKDPSKPGQWRVTRFAMEDGELVPYGHTDAKTYASAIERASHDGDLGYAHATALVEHEARISREPNEHAVVLGPDGKVLLKHTSGLPGRVEFTRGQLDTMISNGDATFTHNHPNSSALSADDLVLAMFANVREMRAVGANGTIYRIERPKAGWGVGSVDEPGEFARVRDNIKRQANGAGMTSSWRMDEIVKQAGGDKADGTKAKGYTDEAWHRIYAEELTKAFNAFSKAQDLGWQIERHEPQAGEGVGREGDAESRGAGVQPGDGAPGTKVEAKQIGHLEGVPLVLEQPPGEGGDKPRGFIRMQLDEAGKPVTFDVQVLAGDKSTFLHETSHFLSWSLHDIAESDLATPEIQADYATFLDWAGYSSASDRLASTEERATLAKKGDRTPAEDARLKELSAKEERISHGWEQYLMEGKAPSEGLAKVFSRFRGWLLRIYKGLSGLQAQYRSQYGQEIGLSDEVRGIFDRLLAQSEALQQAQADTGASPTPDAEITAAMSPTEREEYRKARAGAQFAGERELGERAAELWNHQVGDAREKIAAEVTAELDRQPSFRAQRFLQRGELVDEAGQPLKDTPIPAQLLDAAGETLKLSRKDFLQKYGADELRRMPPGIFHRQKKAGVAVDQLAPLLGFEDGDAMVEAFKQSGPREAAISKETQRRVEEQYGPALEAIQDAALSAVHNDAAARVTLLELRALAKEVDPSVRARVMSIDLPTLKKHVERIVGESTVGSLDPARYARTERATALKAAELWGAGEKEAALEQREARLLNQLLYRAARDAQERLDKIHDKLAGTSEDLRGMMGKADPAYRDVHDEVLAAVGLADKLPPGKTLDQMLQKADEDAQQVAFDVPAIRELLATNRPWESLSVDEARNVADAITNIRHISRRTNEVVANGKRQTKEAWFKDFEKGLSGRKPPPPRPVDPAAQGFGDKMRHLGRGADALLTDVPETYSHMLDVGDREGPVHRLLVDSRLEAREKSMKLQKDVLGKILEKWDDVPKPIRKLRDRLVPELAKLLPVPPGTEKQFSPTYTRSTLWMLFLNWGNEGNRQRVRDGQGWSDDVVGKALSLLTKPELNFLQRVLDTVDGLYPEIAASHEQRTGLRLDKVEATPIVVNGEEYKGGYFPLKYRADLSRAGELQAGDTVKSLFAPNYVRPVTPKGHTKERLEKVDAAVDLRWGVVPGHLSQVIHDVSYGEWVRQAGSILLDPAFKKTTQTYLGPERAQEFVPWLRDVANAKADSGAAASSTFSEELGAFARNRLAVAVMGFNLPAILPQVLDPWNALQEDVPARHVASAYVKVNAMLAGQVSIPEFQLSKELAYRDAMVKDNLRSKLGELGPTGRGVGRAVSETAFALYELSDHYTSRVTWKAAYDAAQSDGLSQEAAVKRADDVVRRTYASHDIAEKPPIMRSKKGVAALVMFYSFANRLYNSTRRSADTMGVALGDEASGAGDKTRAVAKFAAKLMMMGLTGAAVAYVAGRGPKKDDNAEGRAKWLAWRVALEPFNTVPFLGAGLESLAKGQKINMRTAPELALLQDTVNRIGEAIDKGEADEKVWGMVDALILLGGGPAGQVQRTGGYARKLKTGEARPRGPLDAAGGLLYGDKDTANPLSDLQSLTRH